MQVFFFLGIALCLVVDTSTKSVRSIYHDTGKPESPLNSVQQLKETCNNDDSCENGGTCEGNRGGKFCKCLTGTQGNFCEIIDGCDELKCEDGQAKCIYDKKEKTASCSCKTDELKFDYDNGICRETCTDTEDCENGGNCEKADSVSFCRCKNGTEGDFCEIIPKCNNIECGSTAKCVYDVGKELAFCSCHSGTLSFDPDDKTCKKIPFPSTLGPIEITTNATRNSSVEHSWDFTTLNRTSVPSSSTVRPTDGDPCYVNPCQNGGTCLLIDNRSKCFCRKPYLGILCETDPCDWNPCMNEGVCKIEKEEVKCYCKQPFAGKFCESPIKLDAYVVTLVAASVFSAIVLIFVTCVLCQRCRIVGTS